MGLSSDDPLEPQRTYPLAMTYYLSGQFEKALPVVERLIHANPEDRVLHKLQAMTLRELGDGEGAAKCEDRVAKMPFKPSIASIRIGLPAKYDAFADELYSVARA
jgi:predicted Zn-dependent protease